MSRGHQQELDKELTEKVDGFVTYLKQKKCVRDATGHVIPSVIQLVGFFLRLHSSYDIAKRTVLLMREICSRTRYTSAR